MNCGPGGLLGGFREEVNRSDGVPVSSWVDKYD